MLDAGLRLVDAVRKPTLEPTCMTLMTLGYGYIERRIFLALRYGRCQPRVGHLIAQAFGRNRGE